MRPDGRALVKNWHDPDALFEAWANEVTRRLNMAGQIIIGGGGGGGQPGLPGKRGPPGRPIVIRLPSGDLGVNPDVAPGDQDYWFFVDRDGNAVYSPIWDKLCPE